MRRRISQAGCAIAGWLLVSGLAVAHPHSEVDQQAFLSVGLDRVDLTIRIVPSYLDGASIFGLIDDDGNGVVTDDEAMAFGNAVTATVVLELDSERLDLVNVTTTVPGFEHVSAGLGIIEIEAGVSFVLGSDSDHQLAFSIGYDEFSPDWLIQPFFYLEFLDTTLSQAVERMDTRNHIKIIFRSRDSLSAIMNSE